MAKCYALSIFIIFASSCLFNVNHSANVLCMFTSTRKSQLIIFMAVANTLIERGHNVTVITTIPIPLQFQSSMPFRHIMLEQRRETMQELKDNLAGVVETGSKVRSMINFLAAVSLLTNMQRDALEQEQFRKFLQEDNHFDLMLLGYFNNDYLVGVAARYGCPIAVICLGTPYGPISRMIGNPEETSYVQFPLFGRSQPMCFSDRLLNFLWAAIAPCLHVYADRMMESYYKTLFTADFYPKYSDVISNISLVLCNKHFSELPVQPLVPALIQIGGIQFKQQPDPLAEEIQAFLDSSNSGTILYSVGSEIRGSHLKPDKIKAVINVFSRLDHNVLWEWDKTESPPEFTTNILFKRGLPHEDILCQQKVKLYITDGRPNTIPGAQYCGVPMIGIPLYADDPYNVEDMTNKGFGVALDANTLTEDSFEAAIARVLGNPYYSQKVKQFSRIYRDRPATARETAAFWLEYVIRHRGAPHMQSPMVHMDFVELWNIDVIAVILVFSYAFIRLSKLVVFLVRRGLELRARCRKKCGKYKCL